MNSSSTKRRLTVALASGAAIFAFGAGTAAIAAPTGGANSGCAAYAANNVGAPSGNGNATTQPGAGTVGNADNKCPPGQAPDGSDNNKGYECDANQGVGQTNPAHTGCVPSPTATVTNGQS
jgi:hypothetical protein